MGPLLATSDNYYPDKAAELVSKRLVALLPGDPWKKPKPQ
jgi:hypothetical protein